MHAYIIVGAEMISLYDIEYSLKLTIEYSQIVYLFIDLKRQNSNYYFVFIKIFGEIFLN